MLVVVVVVVGQQMHLSLPEFFRREIVKLTISVFKIQSTTSCNIFSENYKNSKDIGHLQAIMCLAQQLFARHWICFLRA